MPRPFRFGVSLLDSAPAAEWRAKCRRAEEIGYDVILVPDHLGMLAPFPALVAAAAATERPRLGTFVLNAGFWNPALLAREVATADALTDGRLELGLGTGYVQAEHDRAGLPFGSPRARVDHLRHTVEELGRLLDTKVPLLFGGNGRRMLRLTAEHADIAAFTGACLVPGNTEGKLLQMVVVTDDPEAAVRPLVDRVPGLTVEQALELPILLVGSQAEVTAKVLALRETYGFSYLTVLEPHLEAFAPVVAELGGK